MTIWDSICHSQWFKQTSIVSFSFLHSFLHSIPSAFLHYSILLSPPSVPPPTVIFAVSSPCILVRSYLSALCQSTLRPRSPSCSLLPRHPRRPFSPSPLPLSPSPLPLPLAPPPPLPTNTRRQRQQILFLNKNDIFERKIKTSDVKTFFPVRLLFLFF